MKYAILIINMLFLILPTLSRSTVKTPANPNSAKGCAICHYRWIDTFYMDGKGSDFVEYQSQKVVATREMCLSCHDGSVKDSRARMTGNFGHKINTKPPSDMHISPILPMDENGNMQCATCHTAHGVQSGPDKKETIFMRVSNKDSALCQLCHSDKNGPGKNRNHPMGVMKQAPVLPSYAINTSLEENTGRISCETCHMAHGSPHEAFLIISSKDSGICLTCHQDKINSQDKTKYSHVINVEPVKVKIPESIYKNGAKLGYHGIITCLTCHKVHNNKIEEQLLLFIKDQKSNQCLICHSSKRYIEETKHNLLDSAPDEKNLDGKTVAQSGVCSACHLPHKNARKFYDMPGRADLFCESCHSKGNVGEKIMIEGMGHPFNVHPQKYETLSKSTLPLFNESGIQDINGMIACLTCHDPHGKKPLPVGAKVFAKNNPIRNKFLRVENLSSPKLCENCHKDKSFIEKTDHDLITTAPFSKNINGQTPVESGICGVCHLVHSNNIKLWAQGFAGGDNIMEMMCTACHSKQGSGKNKIPQISLHPREQLVKSKKGKPGYIPVFHGLSGKQVNTGNISCPSCHNVHKWDPMGKAKGKAIKIKSNITGRFLRSQTLHNWCKDCHKTDSQLRVKYFHNAEKRKFKSFNDLFFK